MPGPYPRPSHTSGFNDGSSTDATVLMGELETSVEELEGSVATPVPNATQALANLGAESSAHASATYAALAQVGFRGGRKWLYAGDSITNGSGASNFAFSYSPQVGWMIGTLRVAADSIEGGTPGYTSANLLAALPTLLAMTPAGVHIQIGTNDAGNAVTLATYQTNVAACVALCKQKGVPVTIGTVPPRGAATATATTRALTAAYNAWLHLWAPSQGIEVAETFAALVDPTTGDMLAAYNSGDGIHPNDAGHAKIAQVVAAALLRTMSTKAPSLVNSVEAPNYVANPLMVGTGTPTGSYNMVAVGTAPTSSIIADTSGALPAGNWYQIDLNAAVASHFGQDQTLNAGWAVGDTLALSGIVQITDVTGGGAWEAAVAAGTAVVSVMVINGSTGVAITQQVQPCSGAPAGSGVYNFGAALQPFVVPVGAASLGIRCDVVVPSGLHIQARFGAFGVLDATALGLAVGGTAMVNA